MKPSATVIADSVGQHAPRLTTVQVTLHRFLLAELNTHRKFSRNFRSSRAVPVKKLLEEVRTNPAMPLHWGANQKGMQASTTCDNLVGCYSDDFGTWEDLSPQDAWLAASRKAADMAEAFSEAGYHKQIVNRLLEPFLWVHGVITSTQWSNFFALRCHPDAQPEMRALAEAIRDAIQGSTPTLLKPGYWHLPYIGDDFSLNQHDVRAVSVARCARVSYLTQDGRTPTLAEDLELYDRLLSAVPLHASPAEHQATPFGENVASNPLGANFGPRWVQYRKTLPGECQ